VLESFYVNLNFNFESPLPKKDLCKLSLKLAQWFWRTSNICKSLTDRQIDGQTDDKLQAIRKGYLSFHLRWV
jgi:hypothetical protein